jgi:hypothetical protein
VWKPHLAHCGPSSLRIVKDSGFEITIRTYTNLSINRVLQEEGRKKGKRMHGSSVVFVVEEFVSSLDPIIFVNHVIMDGNPSCIFMCCLPCHSITTRWDIEKYNNLYGNVCIT